MRRRGYGKCIYKRVSGDGCRKNADDRQLPYSPDMWMHVDDFGVFGGVGLIYYIYLALVGSSLQPYFMTQIPHQNKLI